jgi:K+-transporting ATPase ATPase C chain
VAEARRLASAPVEDLVRSEAVSAAGPFAPEQIVNVLQLNLALDQLQQ